MQGASFAPSIISISPPEVESKQLIGKSPALEEEAMMAHLFLRDGGANELFVPRKTYSRSKRRDVQDNHDKRKKIHAHG
jgi:hypothetical protein